MKFKKFSALVLRAFKNGDLTEEDAVNYLYYKMADDFGKGVFYGVVLGGVICIITDLILSKC